MRCAFPLSLEKQKNRNIIHKIVQNTQKTNCKIIIFVNLKYKMHMI